MIENWIMAFFAWLWFIQWACGRKWWIVLIEENKENVYNK